MPIELTDVCKAFDGRTVLSGLNHVFPDCCITCITGPSGCGKTTLLRLMMGLTEADSGSIHGLEDICISAVFQEDRLIEHLSAFDNVRIVLRRDFPTEAIHCALKSVGLEEAARQPVRELSGGMKRRAALVRALLSDAPVVLMDEPFKGLDAATKAQVIRFAKPLLEGRTVLIVTHDPEEPEMLGALQFPLNENN